MINYQGITCQSLTAPQPLSHVHKHLTEPSKKQFTTISGTETCKGGQATLPFTFVREDIAQNCPRFETMLTEAKELQELGDTLEKDDKAYHAAVIDMIIRGYDSPYAVYMLNVPSKEIPQYFNDEQQIRAVRSQVVEHIHTKASNRKRFATIGITGNFMPQTPIYSKENIELFCTLDYSKYTKEFWDSLWMAGYIDYDFFVEIEKTLIELGYKDYFETLIQIATLPIPEGSYLFKIGGKYLLTRLELSIIKKFAAKTLTLLITRADVEAVEKIAPKAVEDILATASKNPGTTRVTEYVKPGGFNQAGKDFEALKLPNIRTDKSKNYPVLYGELPDGRTVVLRSYSRQQGKPTLEIQQPSKPSIKIRYEE